jgi:hypothetical protein
LSRILKPTGILPCKATVVTKLIEGAGSGVPPAKIF